MRRVAVIASASGNGKTTLGRALAQRLERRASSSSTRSSTARTGSRRPTTSCAAIVEPIVRSDGWVIDGTYPRKLGSLVLDAADTVVWLDLPIRVWLPRLLRRTAAPDHGPRDALERQPRDAGGRRSAAATR